MIFYTCPMQNTPAASEISQDGFRKKIKQFYLETYFWGPVLLRWRHLSTVYSTKNLVKNRKTNRDSRAHVSVANTDFEGGCDGDGRGCGVRHFFGRVGPTQP
jgi:hypothetical protein